jgi:hypothetical protein
MAAFVCFQLVFAAGSGLLAVVLLPAMQAPLDESLVALTTGIWTFSRLFGGIWGVAVPSVIFNNQCSSNAERMITDPAIQQVLMGGSAYAHATQSFLNSIEDPVVRAQVITVFAKVHSSTVQVFLRACVLIFICASANDASTFSPCEQYGTVLSLLLWSGSW